MDAQKVLFQKQFQRFKMQDPEEGFFDVIFEIDGKKLYADKFRLGAVSTTFQSMFSKNWNSKDDPIEIKGNNFEDFKEFLTFIYSGECNLTDENIFAITDIAEFYNIEVLKNICDEYLAKMECSNDNIFYLMEMANKYSLIQLKQISSAFFVKKFAVLAASDKFLTLNGATLKELIIFAEDKVKPEEIFTAICKWGEHQAEIKKAASNDEIFNLNDALKNELSEFLPLIKFRKMKLEFLHKFVVPKAFIFPSLQEISDILCNCYPYVTVRATSPTGQFLEGKIQSNNAVVEIIKSLKNIPSSHSSNIFYWTPKNCKFPSTKSELKKREGVEWYLAYYNKYLGVYYQSHVNDDLYLIAEMFSGTSVSQYTGWKIEIV